MRRVFAPRIGYPAEKLLPDDDRSFFWADLVRDLKQAFAIEITKSESPRYQVEASGR